MSSKTILYSKFHKYVIFILVLLLCFLSLNSFSIVKVKAQTYTDIDVFTAHEMIYNNTQYPDLIVLDVREQSEYDQGHICGAILIPLGELATRISELEPYKDTEIIVYCRTGSRSQTGSQTLVNHNFTKVYNMLGGITAWQAAGFKTCIGNEQVINFSSGIFILIMLSTVLVLLVLYKKKLSRK